MIRSAFTDGLVAAILRLVVVIAVMAMGVTTWAPTAAPGIDANTGATAIAAGHVAHHGSPSSDEPEAPLHTGACFVVCAGGAAALPNVVPSPLLTVIALDMAPARDRMGPGQTPDPALRPPRLEALI